jgi:hypothetical protein
MALGEKKGENFPQRIEVKVDIYSKHLYIS